MATSKIIELTSENECTICENGLGKYSCPKCKVRYCSLTCYQSEKHLDCSEQFYKDCVYEDLAFDQANPNSKTKMLEILKCIHENNSLNNTEDSDDTDELDSDDEIYVDLAERLKGVDLDDSEKVWEKLTSTEKQEFESFLRSGDVSSLIKQWEPWWLYRSEKKVLELQEIEEYKQKCPQVVENIMQFSVLCTKTPSPYLQCNLVNIIASYAFVTRYFNGEYYDVVQESASTIIYLSLVLREAHNFQDSDSAVVSVHQECINSKWITIDQENIDTLKEDVSKIFLGPVTSDNKYYIMCALSDLRKLLQIAIENVKQEKKKKGNFLETISDYEIPSAKLVPKKLITKQLKKIEFYLSYVKDCLKI